MSTRIRISYQDQHELEALLKLLEPYTKHAKVKRDKSPFSHAYLEMKDIPLTRDGQNAMITETEKVSE